ncbi:23S RNA-specific pseudouridylate synthase [Bifidobacterium bombi DSM 19703]|uniref:RNA pseudouridylate synthase n=1 Tax=Bifidobacterium bombi DSM 19703 TaxID=1341695 RepID=A0A080N2K5_9BIFI|nr:pseudouridine synthase [Bifidobacterium bombi]KFF31076.1 23S RNA-specific pseudouridylate synthase [Bifidobacterium bombi DSM 19703]
MASVRHRWVTDEPRIPFNLEVLYDDASIIVVDKPHFLATMPRGMWYRQTALMRLRAMYDDDSIVPAHRLDRMTAGVVLFVRDPALRGAYQTMFQEHKVEKIYECLAPAKPIARPWNGTVEFIARPNVFPLIRRSHIVKERSRLQAREIPGEPNAQTMIDLGRPPACAQGYREYVLHPCTGKTHQLRVHMNSLGLPICGDDLYPTVVDRPYDDFSTPLELVARSLEFKDPVSGTVHRFTSKVPIGVA